MARWYSARPNAVRPRSSASRADAIAAEVGAGGTGAVGPAAISAASAARVATGILVVARPQLDHVSEALAGPHAHQLGGEPVAVVGGQLDLLARIVVGEEGNIDLLAGAGRGGGAVAARIAHQDTRGRPRRIGRHHQVRGPPLEPAGDDRISRQRQLGPDG